MVRVAPGLCTIVACRASGRSGLKRGAYNARDVKEIPETFGSRTNVLTRGDL
jgi:hypothetical protein